MAMVSYHFLALCMLFLPRFDCQSVVVETPVGNIQGKIITDVKNNSYYGFIGIPYALPPVGELRFAKPQPHPKFEGTFDATRATFACPQYGPFAFIDPNGREDCLILNVYSSDLHLGDKKKVLVFIHGGGFIMGSSKDVLPGTFINKHDILVVSIQYRLGLLGFLSTGDETAPGNYGLWDQVLALTWVKNNIAAFGGDPNDVTITGESAGAASVSIISLSRAARGLFTKVYPHSGAATSIFAYAQTPHQDMLRFAKKTGCWDGDAGQKLPRQQSAEVIKCLRKVPLPEISQYVDTSLIGPRFVPVIDGDFLSKSPFELLKDKEYLQSIDYFDIPQMIAINNNEAAFMSTVLKMTEAIAKNYMKVKKEEKESAMDKLWHEFWRFYTQYRQPQASDSSVLEVKEWYTRRYGEDALTQIMTDLSFLISTYDILDAASEEENAKVWLLSFDYYPKFMKGPFRGSFHAIDLVFWLDISLSKLENILHAGIKGRMNEEDMQLRESFSTVIADFVRTGDPGYSLRSRTGEEWPTYNSRDGYYLSFKTDPTVEQYLGHDKRKFWLKRL